MVRIPPPAPPQMASIPRTMPKASAPAMPATSHPSEHNDLIIQLIKSNITLQDKMADVILSIKELNKGVNSLVSLFTDATAHIKTGKYEDPLVEKLNDLLDQNKNLAKGLLLMEDYVRKKQVPEFKHPSAEF